MANTGAARPPIFPAKTPFATLPLLNSHALGTCSAHALACATARAAVLCKLASARLIEKTGRIRRFIITTIACRLPSRCLCQARPPLPLSTKVVDNCTVFLYVCAAGCISQGLVCLAQKSGICARHGFMPCPVCPASNSSIHATRQPVPIRQSKVAEQLAANAPHASMPIVRKGYEADTGAVYGCGYERGCGMRQPGAATATHALLHASAFALVLKRCACRSLRHADLARVCSRERTCPNFGAFHVKHLMHRYKNQPMKYLQSQTQAIVSSGIF